MLEVVNGGYMEEEEEEEEDEGRGGGGRKKKEGRIEGGESVLCVVVRIIFSGYGQAFLRSGPSPEISSVTSHAKKKKKKIQSIFC